MMEESLSTFQIYVWVYVIDIYVIVRWRFLCLWTPFSFDKIEL